MREETARTARETGEPAAALYEAPSGRVSVVHRNPDGTGGTTVLQQSED